MENREDYVFFFLKIEKLVCACLQGIQFVLDFFSVVKGANLNIRYDLMIKIQWSNNKASNLCSM